MNFSYFLLESSLIDLNNSAIEAFPNTTKRQYATDPIEIKQLLWTPYKGMKTLLVRSIAESNGREYNPMILFMGLNYLSESQNNSINLIDKNDNNYYVETPSLEKNNVRVRCNCPDFYWRFVHYDYLDKSLYGRDRKKYEAKYNPGSANPQEMPGMCKHLMKLSSVLYQQGIITE